MKTVFFIYFPARRSSSDACASIHSRQSAVSVFFIYSLLRGLRVMPDVVGIVPRRPVISIHSRLRQRALGNQTLYREDR